MRLPAFCLPFLLGLGLLLPACNDTDLDLPVTGIDVEALVDEYNAELSPQPAPAQKAFAAVGSISDVEYITRADGEETLTFTFEHRKYERTFEFDLEDEVEFPEEIDRAKVVFLGHQMIVADLDSGFYVHLLVPQKTNENLLPGLPYVEGADLDIYTGKAPLSQGI